MPKKLTTKDVVERSVGVHGNTYDYTDTVFVNSTTKIKIGCKVHGDFWQTPQKHYDLGRGCPKCGHIARGISERSNTKEFVEKAVKIHGDKYDYSLVEYIKSLLKVRIICKKHGKFLQSPKDHLRGSGCKKCGLISRSEKRRKIPKNIKCIANRYRARVKKFFNKKGYSRNSKIGIILGCDWVEFKSHLEDNPYGFKIDDKGLNLDHIVPISSASTKEDVVKLNHYTNFQLLPMKYNQHVKSDKDWDAKNFEKWLIDNNI